MPSLPSIESSLPKHHDLFYGGSWHPPKSNTYSDTYNPGNGKVVAKIADSSADDVDAAVTAAHEAFQTWRTTPPTQRGQILRKAADVLRSYAEELAMLDALNTGNPVAEMIADAKVGAANLDYFAGLIPMLKGETIPVSEETFHYTLREPLGVVARIVAYNHPLMFAAGKMAAPLAAGNTVVIKPPEQAPMSCLKMAEILADVFPPGVLSVLPGRRDCGQALSTHPLVRKITLIGSVPTGKAIMRAAADTLKPTLFELGGKNALIACPDADKDKLAAGIARGMNFTWAGQSCGSTSRVFLHESLYDEVLDKVVAVVKKDYKAGVPTDPTTTMGPVISKAAEERVLGYIEAGKKEGAKLVYGGKKPEGISGIEGGYFIEPTIFGDVKPSMKIAREEIFGPVMSVFKWSDEKEMIKQVNSTAYGLTASIYTSSMGTAQRIVKQVESGYVWVNNVGRHFLGVPFGGYKESGIGREEHLEEMLSFTQLKSVNVAL